MSPFGTGVRGVPRLKTKKPFKGVDEEDLALKERLSKSTGIIREAIRESLSLGKIDDARQIVLNYTSIKYLSHELMIDRVDKCRDEKGRVIKGRCGLDESEKWHTLNGIRNRIINVVRFGEYLEDEYVKRLNKKLPGFSRNTKSTFIASGMTYNRHGLCVFSYPVVALSERFRGFSHVEKKMNQLGWPYQGTASQVLRSLYTIALNSRRPPFRRRGDPNEGYSLKSLRSRACEIYEIIDKALDEIYRIRERIG
jgi:hypothetical protein